MPKIDLNGTPTYQGEVLLLGWSENNRDGMTIRLALNGAEEGDTHPFRGLGTGKFGQRFMMVAVPITEQNEGPEAGRVLDGSANPSAGGEDANKPRRKFEDMPPSQQAGILCADAEFMRFLGCGRYSYTPVTSDEAAQAVRNICSVASRAELDNGLGRWQWADLVAEFRKWQTTKLYEEMRR